MGYKSLIFFLKNQWNLDLILHLPNSSPMILQIKYGTIVLVALLPLHVLTKSHKEQHIMPSYFNIFILGYNLTCCGILFFENCLHTSWELFHLIPHWWYVLFESQVTDHLSQWKYWHRGEREGLFFRSFISNSVTLYFEKELSEGVLLLEAIHGYIKQKIQQGMLNTSEAESMSIFYNMEKKTLCKHETEDNIPKTRCETLYYI